MEGKKLQADIGGSRDRDNILTKHISWIKIPSLTVGKIKNGYKPSKHGLCSRFLFRNDMCYIMIFLI